VVDGGEPGVDSREEGKHTGRNDLLFVEKMMWMGELLNWSVETVIDSISTVSMIGPIKSVATAVQATRVENESGKRSGQPTSNTGFVCSAIAADKHLDRCANDARAHVPHATTGQFCI